MLRRKGVSIARLVGGDAVWERTQGHRARRGARDWKAAARHRHSVHAHSPLVVTLASPRSRVSAGTFPAALGATLSASIVLHGLALGRALSDAHSVQRDGPRCRREHAAVALKVLGEARVKDEGLVCEAAEAAQGTRVVLSADEAPHVTDLEGSRSDDAGRDEEENKDDTAKAVRAAALGWRTVGGALSGLEQLSLFLGWKASAADHHDGKPAKAGG